MHTSAKVTSARTDRDVRQLLPLALAAAAAQSMLVVLTPSMVAVAADLGVGIAAVGQARTVTAAVALVAAVVLLSAVSSLGVRRIAVAGSVLSILAGASVAAATSYPVYLLAHVIVGLAVAALLTAGFAGLAAFTGAARSWAAGWVPAAAGASWVVGNPIVGVLTEQVSWRATHLFPSALAAGVLLFSGRCAGRVAVVRGGALRALAGSRQAGSWTLAETLANVSWTSVLTYVGALFIDELGASAALTGWLLALGATCFVVASVLGGRLGATGSLRALVGGSTLALAAAVVVLFGTALVEPGSSWVVPAAGAVAFCLTAAAGGLRIPTSSVLGMAQLSDRPDVMMAARTAAMQAGYLVGAVFSGWVVVTAGWAALGPALAVVTLGSAYLMVRLPAPDLRTAPTTQRAEPARLREAPR